MALTDNLISYWKLDEASGNALDAHGSNELTDTNTVGSASGKINNARDFEFDTAECFVKASNASLSVANEDFTFTAWVNLETKTARRPILGKVSSGGTTEYYMTYADSTDRFSFRVSNGAGDSVEVHANNFGSPSTATFYFVVAWYDSTANTVNIQVNNGTADSSTQNSGSHNGGSSFGIGRFGDLTGESMDGLIDEVGFWKRILTADERTQLYNGGSGLSYDSFGGDVETALSGSAFSGVQTAPGVNTTVAL